SNVSLIWGRYRWNSIPGGLSESRGQPCGEIPFEHFPDFVARKGVDALETDRDLVRREMLPAQHLQFGIVDRPRLDDERHGHFSRSGPRPPPPRRRRPPPATAAGPPRPPRDGPSAHLG